MSKHHQKKQETTLEEELDRKPEVTVEEESEAPPHSHKPFVALPVLYQHDEDQAPLAAIISRIESGSNVVSLAIFDPNGRVLYKHRVSFSEESRVGTWRFPEFLT